MLNFSIVGRDIDRSRRLEYSTWDKDKKERENIAKNFNKLFKNYSLEACIGGEISIDIQKIGSDKGQIFDYLSFYKTKVFFGSHLSPNGNDYSLYKKCNHYHLVTNVNQMVMITLCIKSVKLNLLCIVGYKQLQYLKILVDKTRVFLYFVVNEKDTCCYNHERSNLRPSRHCY